MRADMNDDLNLFEKLGKMPGGDQDPFDTPLGPTEECLTSNQVVVFIQHDKDDPGIARHLENCESCRDRMKRFEQITTKEEVPTNVKKCIVCGAPGWRLCGRMWFIIIYSTVLLLVVSAYLGWIPGVGR